ncbi:MAG: hypothetical protein JWO38_6062 [Gemmataceae bacterium]|nr:hypothetical protein [Gemmataceae bacterium]
MENPEEIDVRRKQLLFAAGLALLSLGLGLGMHFWNGRTGIPDDPDELILFSVDGTKSDREPEERGTPNGQEMLYEYPVLGKVSVTDPPRQREVLAVVRADIRAGAPDQNKCFWPRHVLRVVKDGHSTDVMICFQCRGYMIYRDGRRTMGSTPSIGKESEPVLSKILADAGIPLAP